MATRIEILKDSTWVPLLLSDSGSIKYNAVINKISSMSQREICHTNTFSLPYVYQNIEALGINIYNQSQLAKSFNNKYFARYWVRDELLQQGFIVINNTNGGTININFIDEALEIVEKWGSTTFYDLLNSETISIPEDYKTNIDLMKTYNMSKTSILTPLGQVGTRGYNLAKYPNNLNAIGGKFQIPESGNRLSDTFNPYQSRPIFNVKALFDLAIESFDYTPYYDNSVEWSRIERTYMIEKDLSQSQKGDNSFLSKTLGKVNSNDAASKTFVNGFISDHYINFTYPPDNSTFLPADLDVNLSIPGGQYILKDHKVVDRCIVELNSLNRTSGTVNWKGVLDGEQRDEDFTFKAYAVWRMLGPLFGYSTSEIVGVNNTSGGVNSFDITVNKSQLVNKPTGVLEVMGVALVVVNKPKKVVLTNASTSYITDMVFTETYLPTGVISYDEFDQYEADIINLTHAAPRTTIKELLSSIMQKEGILMSFNNKLKTVKLFSYGSYTNRKNEGNYSDWSQYYQRYTAPLFSTNYGNEYAKVNEIGLSSPYKGNTYKLILANQGASSKYKDFTQNFLSKFKDVEAIQLVENSNTPYYEYTNKGLGLVEISDIGLGALTQVRAVGSQGTFSGLTAVYNINSLILPSGILEWYNIIDTATKVEGTFLLPVEVIKNLEMSEPIYVGDLGGFYIIEEVSEYIDSSTPVIVKLIKLTVEPGGLINPNTRPHYSNQYSDNYSK